MNGNSWIGAGCVILLVINFVNVLRTYHNTTFVWYSDLAWGIKTEIISALVISAIMTGLTFAFWPLAELAIAAQVFVNIKKSKTRAQRLVWIIPAALMGIFVMVMGIAYWVSYFNPSTTTY